MCIRDRGNIQTLHAESATGNLQNAVLPKETAEKFGELHISSFLYIYRKGVRKVAAVSYTHLDVYKRQEYMLFIETSPSLLSSPSITVNFEE